MSTGNIFQLEGKNIVITGASSGIGRATAILCNAMGANTVLVGRDKSRLAETLSQCTRGNNLALPVDLTKTEDTERTMLNTLPAFGPIHGIVHCAGASTTLPLRMVRESHLNELFKINVTAALELTRILIKPSLFSQQGGSIIFLSSVMGVVGEVGKVVYGLTKGALIAGSKSLALELARKNIRVNCISPGVVLTPMSEGAVYAKDESSFEKIKDLHPLGIGEPADVAAACVFLLSDASRWITGLNLTVDGGYTAR